MAHPNEQRLRELYNAFSHGEIDKVLGYCSDDIVFHVPGRSKLAGTYTKAEFAPRLISRVMELSAGTFRESVDDAVANDHHGVVLATATLQRGDTPHEFGRRLAREFPEASGPAKELAAGFAVAAYAPPNLARRSRDHVLEVWEALRPLLLDRVRQRLRPA